MPVEPGRRAPRPPVRARTKEEVLRRIDPKLRDIMGESLRRDAPEWVPPADEVAEIYPTALNVTLIYIPGASHQRPIRIFSAGLVLCQWTGGPTGSSLRLAYSRAIRNGGR
jgi:hypothetical protein